MRSLFCALVAAAAALLPPPLPLVCEPTLIHGCYNDSWTRTFPTMASNGGPSDPFGANATLETCAYLCALRHYSAAAIENGAQCFCASPTDLAHAAPNLTDAALCSTPCAGNSLVACGGTWKALAYDFSCAPFQPSAMPWQNASLPAAARVEDLVARLSPTGLVGQMLQNGIDYYGAGIQLPRYIVSQECLAGFDGGDIYIAPPVLHTPSSGFPQPVNLGNTWDAELVREVASAISDEARAAFNLGRPSLTCMSPNLNLNRDPRWGRNVESLGEDPALVAALGKAYINGIQLGTPANASAAASGYLKIMAVPKHLGAYSVECYDPANGGGYPNCPVYRNTYNAVADAMDLRESYFPAWEAAVRDASAMNVMCSYNEINGVPACGNGELLRDTLEQEWGMQGFVISDADAVAYIGIKPDENPMEHGHGFVPTLKEAALSALLNGTTISLEDTDPLGAAYATQLLPALAAGSTTLESLRAAARRALLPRFRVGLYDDPSLNPWAAIPASVIESPQHHALARRAARESLVLLKNDRGLLPLLPVPQGGPARLALVGPTSNCSACGVGRYSGHPSATVGIWQGLSAAAAAAGATLAYSGEALDAQAIALLASADVGIIVLTGTAEGESQDRFEVGFPAATLAWLGALAAAAPTLPPLVLLVASGGAVDSAPALQLVDAALAIYTGGMEYGSAVADVLYGAENPSGALAHTIYKSSWIAASDFLSMAIRAPPGRGHRYLTPQARSEHVLFPLGWGLSYTNWTSQLLAVTPAATSASALAQGANVTLSVRVSNVGAARAGARVVYAMLSRVGGAVEEEWPVQWLGQGGFAKVHGVAPGGGEEVQLVVGARDLSRWDEGAGGFVVRAGSYGIALRDGGVGTITVTP